VGDLRISLDPEADAAYLALSPDRAGNIEESVPVRDRAGAIALVVDLSSDGRVLGIEFLNASRRLPDQLTT
jgi:uncharacterized protein YuzE